MKFSDINQLPRFYYQINVPWGYIEQTLSGYAKTGLDLSPDFQRAHVWSEDQQVAYVEYVLRGGEVGRSIVFNNDGPNGNWGFITLVDGKQRIEAVRKFMRNELRVFGHSLSGFEDKMRIFQDDFLFRICNLHTKAELLQLYLNINARGTPHTEDELNKVWAMLELEEMK